MSQATITALYAALARLDGAAMGRLYAPAAQFDDEAFALRGQAQISGMWRMLCDTTRAKAAQHWRVEASQITARSAHWEAHYQFSSTGRLVHNIIDAEFEFDAQGLILRQRDRFDFWRWSRQALGLPGWLLGWTPLLRSKVRKGAAANLAAFMARSPSA